MKKMKNIIYMLLLSVAIFSCKKRPEGPDQPIPDKDIPGAVRSEGGALVGSPVKDVIGVQGGVLKFPNTEVKLTIPAGAVQSDVEFSIQEVEYKLPFGAIGKAYRFLPENVNFKKDVEITIPFGELTNTSTKALSLAYQDNKGDPFSCRCQF